VTRPTPPILPRWLRPLLGAALALALAGASALLFRPLDPPAQSGPAADAPASRERAPAEPSSTAAPASAPASHAPTAPHRPAQPIRPAADDPRAPRPALLAAPADEAPTVPIDAQGPDVDASTVSETADAPVVRGVWPTDPEGIRSAIREALPDLRECYQAWVQAHPELEGVVKASFTITAAPQGAEGRVSEVHLVESTLDQPFLEGCVLNVLSALHFEAPTDGPVTVTYPFILHADR
jgi:hypothetical protein